MFNIYKEEGEEMTENAKLRELFKRTKHPQLIESVKALEVRYDMDGLTYTQAANHLTAAVSKLPDYQMARHVSNVKTGEGKAINQHAFIVMEIRSTPPMAQSGLVTMMNGP